MLLKKYWLLELSIFLVSFFSLIGIGVYWLWLNQWLWLWLSFALSLLGVALLINSGFTYCTDRRKIHHQKNIDPQSAIQLATADLLSITEDIKDSHPDLDDLGFHFNVFCRVVETVAGRFYPEQKNAHLELNIPYFLKVVELICRDLRLTLIDNVPGSHMVSLGQLVSAQYFASKGARFYGFFHELTRGTALDSALLAHIKNNSKMQLRDWFIELYVQKIGHYAIEIYSGSCRPDNDVIVSRADATTMSFQNAEPTMPEPIRMLVLGQTGSGKSSFINALFGDAIAEADVIPSTKGVTAYLLQNHKLEQSIVMDSEGYGSDSEELLAEANDELLKADMVVLLVSAVNPARDIDCRIMQQIRANFALVNKPIPPLVVALSHIDQLRPWREWCPPYNIAEPDRAKACNIRDAMHAVADDLKIGLDNIAAVCIKPGRVYNLEEGLIPTLLQNLDRAKQLRYLRCIACYQDEDYWRRLWRQSKNAGRFIAREAYKLTL